MAKLWLNTKWNNVTSVQCWQRLTNLAISAGKVAKNYCGFAVVADETRQTHIAMFLRKPKELANHVTGETNHARIACL